MERKKSPRHRQPKKIKVTVKPPRKRKVPWRFPRGYIPARDSPKSAKDNIKKWLEVTAGCVQKHNVGARVIIGVNADLTIDGQMNGERIPRNYRLRSLLIDVEDCWFNALSQRKRDITRDYFCQGGVDVKMPEGSASVDRRYRGLNRYMTWWYRLSNFFPMIEALRTVAENVQRKRGKPFRIWFRIHWNHQDVSPGSERKRGAKGPRR